MPQANVFDAMGQSYSALQTSFQDGARTRAGRAYGAGDREGAISALGQGGLVAEASSLDDTFMRRDNDMMDRQRADRAERAEFTMNAASTLRRIPYAQREAAYRQIRPVLESYLPPEVLEQLDAADKSDTALDAFTGALGQEAERLQLFSTRQGIVGVRQGPEGPSTQMVYESPVDPNEGVPAGYRRTPDGNLSYIPGGPADPGVIGTRAAAGRALPRGRSGGGSRQSGGSGSAPRPAAPRPSGRPWERY